MLRKAAHALAKAALDRSAELLRQEPVPTAQIAEICDPAAAALKALAGERTAEETAWLRQLDQARRGEKQYP
jgi:hypothetical protein